MDNVVMNNSDINLAKKYYNKLKTIVEDANKEHKTLADLCKSLKGHNLNEGLGDLSLFDVNYGNICATVLLKEDKLVLYNVVEIWRGDSLLDEYFDMSKVTTEDGGK